MTLLSTLTRVGQHLCTTSGAVRRMLGADLSDRIRSKIAQSEREHTGQVVVVVEAALEPLDVFRGKTGALRAIEVFSEQRVWDTERNNGVLLYVLLADRDIEILADRGISAHVSNAAWQEVCASIEGEFRAGNFVRGIEGAIEQITSYLRMYYPRTGHESGGRGSNELSDVPTIR